MDSYTSQQDRQEHTLFARHATFDLPVLPSILHLFPYLFQTGEEGKNGMYGSFTPSILNCDLIQQETFINQGQRAKDQKTFQPRIIEQNEFGKQDSIVSNPIDSTDEDLQRKEFNESRAYVQIVSHQEISDIKLRQEIPPGVDIQIIQGQDFDVHELRIEETVPLTKNFRIFKYKNPATRRFVKILKCDYDGCDIIFRKWHNFFDHLRVHTGERPFICHHADCQQAFTQKANLNKHMEIHKKKKKLVCSRCKKHFSSSYLLRVIILMVIELIQLIDAFKAKKLYNRTGSKRQVKYM
ncbi:krueppel-like factor 13 [Stylonychia lemnae]|uniref:Krueppel-like factor 13 n=1 Tax=Stylonychia lemnae TaxID=5949 RepID=A0A077ZZH6_STYLE|nr:krueppel-like factor 13 [Stylonychia lemnae]|eukprot:CDW75002.1 krueppel-like factor 13 [Stylonychia lemnae]